MTATKGLKRHQVITPVPDLVTEWFDDNEFAAAVYQPDTGDHHHLDGAASAVWAICEEPITVGDLVSEITTLGASPDEAREVVDGALSSFADVGLIAVDGEVTVTDVVESSAPHSSHSHHDHDHDHHHDHDHAAGAQDLPREPDP